MLMLVFFFFSSRRRHTRWPRDWSSDVCSSDLREAAIGAAAFAAAPARSGHGRPGYARAGTVQSRVRVWCPAAIADRNTPQTLADHGDLASVGKARDSFAARRRASNGCWDEA